MTHSMFVVCACMWVRVLHVGMHDEIFHFEIFKNFVEVLKYFKSPSLKYFMKFYFHYKVT